MWWPVAAELVEPWTRAMGRACLTGSLAIAGAWLICRSLPRMSPTVRSWIWRLVYLKLTLLMLWPGPIRMPLLPSPSVRIERLQVPAQVSPPGRKSPIDSLKPTPWSGRILPEKLERSSAKFSSVALQLIWLIGILVVTARNIRNTIATQKILRESHPLIDPRLRQECDVLSSYLRLKRCPQLLSHEQVSSPQVFGLVHPAILFPAWFVDRFSTQEVRLVLAHELAHLQRNDLLWSWVRRLVNGLLFFHPLVWVAHEQATLAEEIACDEIALGGIDATISDYAGTLVKVTEQSLLTPSGGTALLGTAMSRGYRVMARRLQALKQLGTVYSTIARGRRRRATLLGCLAIAVLLPLGLMNWFHSSGIRQIDSRYQVLGFKVSRGWNHTVSVRREVCRIGGFRLSRVIEDTNQAQLMTSTSGLRAPAAWTSNPNVARTGIPFHVAGWLQKLGFKPELDMAAYTSGVYLSYESCAVIVRFAHNPLYESYEDIGAYLVDDHGETIPLAPERSESPSQSGEYVKFWVISPAPVTRAKFTLRLRLAEEGKDVAVLSLGEL
jgi:beta-lactamase regulating signal transducer with metallopeptidase domain